ncbi:unnamed protein product [Caenorhabditis sp. 36 PRJEB53466]|nr:unnamed protein product [Caenorhabditis sp. 36 PRJEB53466]
MRMKRENDRFDFMVYLSDDQLIITNMHPVWDKYNFLAIDHMEEMDFNVNVRDVTSERDCLYYRHLLDNWSEDVTIDILFSVSLKPASFTG